LTSYDAGSAGIVHLSTVRSGQRFIAGADSPAKV